MRRTLIYAFAAVILGISLILVPMIAAAEVKTTSNYNLVPEYIPAQLKGNLGNYGSISTKNAPEDLEVLVISFAIASGAYLWIRRKTPHDERALRLSQYQF